MTLTHLRRLLEPDRSGGDASYHVRTDGDTIRLLEAEFLSVDLWTLNVLDRRAGQARADGDIAVRPPCSPTRSPYGAGICCRTCTT